MSKLNHAREFVYASWLFIAFAVIFRLAGFPQLRTASIILAVACIAIAIIFFLFFLISLAWKKPHQVPENQVEARRKYLEDRRARRNMEVYSRGIEAYKKALPRLILEGKRLWFVAFRGDELILESPNHRKFKKGLKAKGLSDDPDVFAICVSEEDIEATLNS